MNDNYFFSSTDTSKKGLGMTLFREYENSSLEETMMNTELSSKLRGKNFYINHI